MRRLTIVVVAGAFVAALSSGVSAGRLSFKERVDAQAAVERVYQSHRTGAKRSFEEVWSREALAGKVRTYLKQSRLLEERWHRPVTADALRRELARMARGTKMPSRLEELYEALDRDSFVVQECLVRPILVDRLARNFFAFDPEIQRTSREAAVRLREQLRELPFGAAVGEREPSVHGATSGDFPGGPVRVGPVREDRDRFFVRVYSAAAMGGAVYAEYSVPKRRWDDWWREVRDGLDETLVRTVASPDLPLPVPGGSSLADSTAGPGTDVPPDDAWQNGALNDGPPVAREGHAAVWTGSEMLVWGGGNGDFPRDGGRYDPVTDTWTPMTKVGAPEGRKEPTAVWTGDEMIVWGGETSTGIYLKSGGRYDPALDRWTPTTEYWECPAARGGHTAVWTGSRMIVWGGQSSFENGERSDGAMYDPVTDRWQRITPRDVPLARAYHTAVWTGTEMVIWGGKVGNEKFRSGGRYDPVTDSWRPVMEYRAPAARSDHTAVWTGSEMIVWGGATAPPDRSRAGARYDPVADWWEPMNTTGAPHGRNGHTAVWTGSEMLIWGGSPTNSTTQGGGYDPAADRWRPISESGEPPSRSKHTAVWTGSEMIVWGGNRDLVVDTGGRYDPASDSWTPTSLGSGPSRRYDHAAVWTGSEMIVWGGYRSGVLDTGARYDPATDYWTPTSTSGAPSARDHHTAVWTGDEMVVWGGEPEAAGADGGRYDPATDQWNPVSTSGAPSARSGHTAVWTGTEMIEWGGTAPDDSSLDTGGSYDPASDKWRTVSTIGAPSPRIGHTAVWTGDEMIVWGGYGDDPYDPMNTGGRYDPATDTWIPVSTSNAPAGRRGHTAVWTGDEMIVWGGSGSYDALNTGGRYDPDTDSWTATSTEGAPDPRSYHAALYAANLMLVWGGRDGDSLDTGGRYDPVTDTWTSTTMIGVPPASSGPTAVWTGESMLVWGGASGYEELSSGGGYLPGHVSIDDDGDGISEIHGDCDDTDPTVHAIPSEIADLQWPDAVTLAWESDVPNSGEGTRYDVLYGDLAEVWREGEGASDVCMADDVPGTSAADGAPVPAAGLGWYYLVRGDNSCGAGPYHDASDGTPYTGAPCP